MGQERYWNLLQLEGSQGRICMEDVRQELKDNILEKSSKAILARNIYTPKLVAGKTRAARWQAGRADEVDVAGDFDGS